MKRLLKRRAPLLVCTAAVAAVVALGAWVWSGVSGEDLEMRLTQARVALANGNPEQALRFAEKVLIARPGEPEAARICREANELLEQSQSATEDVAPLDAVGPVGPVAPVDWTFMYADRVGRRKVDANVGAPAAEARLARPEVSGPDSPLPVPTETGRGPGHWMYVTGDSPMVVGPGGYLAAAPDLYGDYRLGDSQYAYDSDPNPTVAASSSEGGSGATGGGDIGDDAGSDDPSPTPMLGEGAAPEPASLGIVAAITAGVYALRRHG